MLTEDKLSYNIYPTPDFKKFFKKLYKKYPSLKTDPQKLIQILKEKPDSGIHLGHGYPCTLPVNQQPVKLQCVKQACLLRLEVHGPVR